MINRLLPFELQAKQMTLAELTIGQQATITSLNTDSSSQRRLLDHGLLPGITVTLVRRAPMQDPLHFQVGCSNIALRSELAKFVEVTCS